LHDSTIDAPTKFIGARLLMRFTASSSPIDSSSSITSTSAPQDRRSDILILLILLVQIGLVGSLFSRRSGDSDDRVETDSSIEARGDLNTIKAPGSADPILDLVLSAEREVDLAEADGSIERHSSTDIDSYDSSERRRRKLSEIERVAEARRQEWEKASAELGRRAESLEQRERALNERSRLLDENRRRTEDARSANSLAEITSFIAKLDPESAKTALSSFDRKTASLVVGRLPAESLRAIGPTFRSEAEVLIWNELLRSAVDSKASARTVLGP
jgi:hypothetical protein